MSVLACNRNGCPNIMCDRYSYEYGYICNECFDELVNNSTLDAKSFMLSSKPNHLAESFLQYRYSYMAEEFILR